MIRDSLKYFKLNNTKTICNYMANQNNILHSGNKTRKQIMDSWKLREFCLFNLRVTSFVIFLGLVGAKI